MKLSHSSHSPWKSQVQRFPHSHRTDDYDLSEGPILTFLSGAQRDIPIGRQQDAYPLWFWVSLLTPTTIVPRIHSLPENALNLQDPSAQAGSFSYIRGILATA